MLRATSFVRQTSKSRPKLIFWLLKNLIRNVQILIRNPFQQLEDERKEAEARLEKMKAEMEGVFDHKVKEKIARLKESEANVSCILLKLISSWFEI